jgi:hypothetical protein
VNLALSRVTTSTECELTPEVEHDISSRSAHRLTRIVRNCAIHREHFFV